MASEDVIELGSSDDDAEPAPKKKKPMPSAVGYIPSKLPGVTIKPAKSISSDNRAILRKPIVIKKPDFIAKPINRTIKPNTGAIKVVVNNKIFKSNSPIISKGLINPLSIAKTLRQTEVVVKKVVSNKRLRNPVEIQGPKVLNNLHSAITLKVHSANTTITSIQKASASGLIKKQCLTTPKNESSGNLITVEVDDEDVTESATASPQWYLRPEEQVEKDKNAEANMEVDNLVQSMEETNNKEPEKENFVEITIEDSPMKPDHSKYPAVDKDLTITIEDSPNKPNAKNTKAVKRDGDLNENIENKTPQSKKKLNYPKENDENHVVEIEIDLKEGDSIERTAKEVESPKHELNEETAKEQKMDLEKDNSSKKEASVDVLVAKETDIEDSEFHPTFQEFICMCFRLENTKDMKKIVDKKIKAYYRQCPKEYVESEEFVDMVSSKTVLMKAAPGKMFLYIKDIVDELNLQRNVTKAIVPNAVDMGNESPSEKSETTQYDSKKRRQIRKLEKTIKKLHRAIQKLEEQEVDFDDDEDSVYLLTERYKERMVRVHAKFCQLTNTKMPSEPRIHIEPGLGRPTGPAKKVEKWINRKVPIGTPLPFPDFHDVLRCVRDANEEDKLCWNETVIMEEARELFTKCGKKLQRRRQENEWRVAASRLCAELDPAESSLELKQKLDENKTLAAKREAELLNKYVDKQNLLKLVAEEIGDKEAEESPIESEEDEVEKENGLNDKQKRKHRLKRLIKEKSKKGENKENYVRKDCDQNENIKETKEESKVESKDAPEKVDKPIEIKPTNTEMAFHSISNETEITEDKEVESEVKDQKENDDNSDSNKVESDIDELHLLQKLHSENEVNTSELESSDSDTPIAISDTLSDSEVDNDAKSCDVISIENSSYSETESTLDGLTKDNDSNYTKKQSVELENANFEIEYSSAGIEETNKATWMEAEIEETEENILLASSDEDGKYKGENLGIEDTCINLRDDNISISETVIVGGTVEEESRSNDGNVQENINAVEIIDVSPLGAENNVTLDMTQQNFEDAVNSLDKAIKN